MKKLTCLASLCFLLFLSCNDDIITGDKADPATGGTNEKTTVSGSLDGVDYSLSNLSVNSDLIVVNQSNASLDANENVIILTGISESLADRLSEDAVVYFEFPEYTALRKITKILSTGEKVELETEISHLGELFEEGAIDFSLNVLEACKAHITKSGNYSYNEYYEILKLIEEYQLENTLTLNPGIYLEMFVNARLGFQQSQILPSEFSFEFMLQPVVNPSFYFTGAVNQKYRTDLSPLIPEQLLELIRKQEFEIDIPINIAGISSLPVKVSIQDIKLPVEIEAVLSNQSTLGYGVDGQFGLGCSLLINGLRIQKEAIVKNDLKFTAPAVTSNYSYLYGEVITNNQIVITPAFSVLGDLYNVAGDLTIGIGSATHVDMSVSGDSQPVFNSKGTFYANMDMDVDLVLTSAKVELLNIEKELWNIGTIDKTLELSDISWKVSSSYTTNLLLLSRVYDTEFTVKYAYPVKGKRIPDELYISYDVYREDDKTQILSKKEMVIKPTNITEDSFTFRLEIPYYKSGLISYQSKSYLKNIVIRDRNDYTSNGIYNNNSNAVSYNFLIQR